MNSSRNSFQFPSEILPDQHQEFFRNLFYSLGIYTSIFPGNLKQFFQMTPESLQESLQSSSEILLEFSPWHSLEVLSSHFPGIL